MKQLFQTIPLALLLIAGCASPEKSQTTQLQQRWTEQRANQWSSTQPWLVGCNFAPSSAINQLEMWQADSWDPKTIDRELGWAEDLGFTSVRVFLHDLAWKQDRKGFLNRMEQFLDMAEKHGIGVMFVLFDAVWDPFPKAGMQREPKPHVHNSGWVQSPGADLLGDPARHDELKPYVQDVIRRFRTDRRVRVWDVFNEPDNPVPQYTRVELPNKKEMAYLLLEKTFAWAREVKPIQPLTSGVWIGNWPDTDKLSKMEKLQLEESDVISFHTYGPVDEAARCVEHLRRYNRPLLCTEYMARPQGSRFDPVLGFFAEQNVGAYNWGFVSGKSQTIYPWDSWTKVYTAEPPEWFHDIFRVNGAPYRQEEVDYIKTVTKKKAREKGAASSPTAPDIGIGGGETNSHSHLRFEGVPKDARIVRVSTHLIVDKVAPVGLNFFAVQVNFPNKTWAHGGPQVNSGAEKANWGGLVNRGGGSKDYKETNWKEDLLLIEYGIEKANTVPFKWERNCEYILTVERGKQVHLPAGTNQHYNVVVPEHTMWEWRFTIEPVTSGHESFTSLLYDSADHISSFYLWNESGYGSTGSEQHTKWSLPTYRTESGTEDKAPTGWKRF